MKVLEFVNRGVHLLTKTPASETTQLEGYRLMRAVPKEDFVKILDKCDLIYAFVRCDADDNDGEYVCITKKAALELTRKVNRVKIITMADTLYIGN